MTELQILEALQDAIKLITQTRTPLAQSSNVVWRKLYSATEYLDKQVASLLADEQPVAEAA
jgi:hypothetical protein